MTRGKQGAVRGRQGNMLSGISQECGGAGSTVNPPPSPHTPRTPPHLRLEDGCRLHKRGVRGVARAENHRRGEPAGRGGEGKWRGRAAGGGGAGGFSSSTAQRGVQWGTITGFVSSQRQRQRAPALPPHRLGGDQKSEPVEVLASSGNVKTSCVRGGGWGGGGGGGWGQCVWWGVGAEVW